MMPNALGERMHRSRAGGASSAPTGGSITDHELPRAGTTRLTARMRRGGRRCDWVDLRAGGCSMDTRGDTLHLIFAVQFHFFELYFFDEGFRTEVGICGDFL